MKSVIQTRKAPQTIGPYSQAVKHGNVVYISGQIPLDPQSMTIVSEEFKVQAEQVFKNLRAICEEAGGRLDSILKLNISVTDLSQFATVNHVMETNFNEPYPARATVQVAALPKNAQIEVEAILGL